MKVLVVNAGSSSLKYQLIDMTNESVLAKGNCERIGSQDGILSYKNANGEGFKKETPIADHKEAFNLVINELINGDYKCIDSLEEIGAVGHRTVQGGAVYAGSVLVTDDVKAKIDELKDLAPLHNPANLIGINACTEALGSNIPQVAVFDTAFHQTMPAKAYMFAIPYKYYENDGVRRYGFHGTSHRFVSGVCADTLGRDIKDLKIITCHLGNGCSIAAVQNGECVDTTMGLTPVDGFMMGTRCGALDPSILVYLAKKYNMTPDELDKMMNKESGLLGVSGISNDSRDVCAKADEGDKRAQLAIEMQYYQIIKYIGSYAAAMNGVDAIVFTAGIGENNPEMRRVILDNLTYLGIKCDYEANSKKATGDSLKISTDDSKVSCFVIPTNEELVIARDTYEIVKSLNK